MYPRDKKASKSLIHRNVALAIGLFCLLDSQQAALGLDCVGKMVLDANGHFVCKEQEPPKVTGLDLDLIYGGSLQFNKGVGVQIDLRPHRFVQLEAVAFYGKGTDVDEWTDSGNLFLRVPFLAWVGRGFGGHLVQEALSIEAGGHWGTLPFRDSSEAAYSYHLHHVFYPSLSLRFDWYDKMDENPVGTRVWTVALRGHYGPLGTPSAAPGTQLLWKGHSDFDGMGPYPGTSYGCTLYARVTLLYYVSVAVELGTGALPEAHLPFGFWGGFWLGASFPVL